MASGRFGMHDLLRLFARATCQEADDQATRDAAEARLVGHYADLARFLDSCVDPQLRPAAAQAAEQAGVPLPSMREALAMFEAERPSLLAALGLAVERGWDEQVVRLGESMGESLTLLRYLDDLLTVREAALAAARRAGDTPAEGKALDNLGKAYRDCGGLRRPSAATSSRWRYPGDRRPARRGQDAEKPRQRLPGAAAGLRRPSAATSSRWRSTGRAATGYGEGRTLSNLGNAYRGLGRFEEAIGCYEKSLAIFRETGDRYGEGRTLRNLGDAYRELRRFEEAIGCYEESLAIYRESGERHGEGTTLSNLGNAYWDLGQPDRAAGYWRDAAAAMRNAGDHEEAARLEQQAVKTQPRSRRPWQSLRRGSSP